MASDHTSDPDTFYSVVSMLDGSDVMSATQLRTILERIHDNTGYLQAVTGLASLSFTGLDLDNAPPTTTGLAAIHDAAQDRVVLVKGGSNGSTRVSDDGFSDTIADSGTLTSARSMALDPVSGRVVAVGLGGGQAAFSDDFGASWTDSTTPVGVRDTVVWDAVNGLFLGSRVGQATIFTSTNGVTFTSRALTAAASSSVAVTSTGIGCVGRGNGGSIVFDRSTNGITWAAAGGTLPNVADATGSPALCALGNKLYAAAVFTSGGVSTYRVHSSIDGSTWVLVSSIPLETFVGLSSQALYADPYSGALYAVAIPDSKTLVWLSLDNGVSWLGPARLRAIPSGIAVAGGRVFVNQDSTAKLRMSVVRLPAAV